MWFPTIRILGQRGTLLMTSTCRTRARSIDTCAHNLSEVAFDVLHSLLSIAGVTKRSGPVRGDNADRRGGCNCQTSSPAATLAGQRSSDRILGLAQSSAVRDRSKKGD